MRVYSLIPCMLIGLVAACASPKPDTVQGRPPVEEPQAVRPRAVHIKTHNSSRYPTTIQGFKREVLKVFRDNRSDFNTCKKHVKVTHKRGVYVNIKLTLNGTGEATDSVLTTQDKVRDRDLIGCVEQAVLSWEYPFHPKSLESTQTININIKR